MRNYVLFALALLLAVSAIGQTHRVTGDIKDDRGEPVPFATITETGTKNAVTADATGHFTININRNQVTVSATGHQPQTFDATGGDLSVTLQRGEGQLQEVVVTALGIRKSRNQVGYATQQIVGEEVAKNRSNNFVSNLSGKVSGLEIRQNNSMGASTNVVLRGVKSITGNNQALFVVDGVPVNNANVNLKNNVAVTNPTYLPQEQGGGGYDYGNAVADINPDDIESISVLKGAAASALYGSIGANGVILITTKKGKKGLGIVVNSGVGVGMADKATLPKYQKLYGAGYGAFYEDPTGHFLYRDVNGDGIDDLITPVTEDASYGAAFDPSLNVYQWDAFDTSSAFYGKARPWVAGANDPNSFYEKPFSTNNSIFLNGGSDKGNYKLGFTRNEERGIMPNSRITKNIIDFSSSYNITPNLTASGSINYSQIKGLGRYSTGYDGTAARNLMTNFRQWWEMNVDIKEMKDAFFRHGDNVTWNWADPTNLVPIYWDNPYYIRYKNYETDERNRYFGNAALNYKLTSWLNIMGRIAIDQYNELQEERKDVQSVGTPFYSRFTHSWSETNYDLHITADKNLSTDFNLKALLGTNIRKQRDQGIYAITNGGLVVPGVFTLANSASAPNAPTETDLRREVDGVFANASLSWRNMISVDGSIRRDASSTLPKGNNVYYYPSASAGFVFSQLLKSVSWLSYGKLRANYAQVGNDAPIYSVYDSYVIVAPFGENSQASVSGTKNNTNLKPERTKSAEAGIELSFLKSRIGLDVSYYKAKSFDQIVPVALSTATGYSFIFLNSGAVQNQGIEVSLNGTPVSTRDFSWNISVNWSRNRNKVLALFKDATGEEAQNLLLGNYQGGITLNAALGKPYGELRGTNFIYTNGQRTVGANGRYLKTTTSNETIGNINPDWIGGINNSVRFKNISLSFLIDIRKGGDVFSTDMYYGLATGLLQETAGLNDLGNPSRNTIADGGGFIRPGVKEDGKVNDIRVSNSNFGAYGYSVNPDAAFVYDASYVKLREAQLSFAFPKSIIERLKVVKGIDLALIGRNLWIIHKNLPYSDPEEGFSSGNFQGVQTGAYPTVRTIMLNLKLTF